MILSDPFLVICGLALLLFACLESAEAVARRLPRRWWKCSECGCYHNTSGVRAWVKPHGVPVNRINSALCPACAASRKLLVKDA